MLSYAEITKRCAIESLKYKALHASGATGAVRLSVFVACGLSFGNVRARRAGVRIPSLRAVVHVKYGCARSARKFWRILANFGRISYIFLTYLTELPGTLYELCTNSVRTLHEFRGIMCELL